MTRTMEPRLEVAHEGNRTVVRFLNCASLNEFSADQIGQQLASLPASEQVVLDMSPIEYLTSTVLGHLIGLNKRLRTAGGRLLIENAHPAVIDVFRVTQLDHVMDIRPA